MTRSRRVVPGPAEFPQLPAKVSAPLLPRVVRRPRLFKELDRALTRRVVWVGAPPGAGKTTLVGSYLRARRRPAVWYRLDEGDADLSSFVRYLALATRVPSGSGTDLPMLTPEFRPGVSVFLRRFFERLSSRLPARSVVVFDDYHTVPADADLHELLPVALGDLSSNVTVIIVSRAAPPVPFSTLEARGALSVLPPDALSLTDEELRDLVALYHPSAKPADRDLWLDRAQAARGWLAGATLLLQRDASATLVQAVSERSRQAVFDFLTHEALARRPFAEIDFLLKTSLLPRFTPALANQVTGASFASTFLEHLYRTRFFTERVEPGQSWYGYHPLFRECLATLARHRLTADERLRVCRAGGRLLIESGRVEDGISLLVESHDEEEAARAILSAAPVMVREGRLQTLEQWLTRLPPHLIDEQPWLRYWLAVSLLLRDSFRAERLARQAMAAFHHRSDVVGELSSWSLTVNAIMMRMGDFSSLDALIEAFPYRDPDSLPAIPAELMLQVVDALAAALAWRQTGRPLTHRWVQYAIELKGRTRPVGQTLAFPFVETHFLWVGDVSHARVAFSTFKQAYADDVSVSARLARISADAVMSWFEGDSEQCRQAIDQGVQLGRVEGLFLYEHPLLSQGIYNELMSGDSDAAGPLVSRTRPPASTEPGMVKWHHATLDAWYRMHRHELGEAWALVRPDHHRALDHVGPYAEGYAWLVRAFIKILSGELNEAEFSAGRATALAEEMNSDLLRHGIGFVRAHCAFARGDDAAGRFALSSTLGIGRRLGLWGCPGWHVPTVAALVSRALRSGIEVEYARRLVRKRRLPRPADSILPDTWAWPIRIVAFGGFGVSVDGAPLATNRKAPHRLLEVLRAIIALGAADVPTERLADCFWPDVEGDAARENLDKTLQRLRRLLGHPDVLPVRGGLVTLNPDVCWVDVVAFEQLVAQRAPAAAVQALTLYNGPLFGRQVRRPWERHARERVERARHAAEGIAARP